jgi:hypothetical protein
VARLASATAYPPGTFRPGRGRSRQQKQNYHIPFSCRKVFRIHY